MKPSCQNPPKPLYRPVLEPLSKSNDVLVHPGAYFSNFAL
jgi:hypothetical protein